MEDLTVTLSRDMAELVARKMRSGAYASIDDVIRDGLRTLDDRDADIERWLRDEVLPGHAECLADPGQAVPSEDILDRIKARRASAT